MKKMISGEISIVLSGEAGQGIQSIEGLLTKILKKEGLYVFATKEYMSRVRGGINSTEIRVSENPVKAFVNRIDLLISLKKEGITHLKNRISNQTIVLDETPFLAIANETGGPLYSNTAAVGYICGLLELNQTVIEKVLSKYFGKKSPEIIQNNFNAARKGYELAQSSNLTISIKRNTEISKSLVLDGAEAIALGALAGGCNYVCAYPMSPGTSVLTAMAEYSKKIDVVVEQVEDEIGVANMAIGAWYAGARALVTTSGGGFALMTEALSLAGIIETPIVIHLAQRPGPATGLPTRTEQGDLNLALYAGHGVFARIILAPGTTEEAYYLAQKAFNMADEYQVPVIVLTDQYFVDTYYNVSVLKLNTDKNTYHIRKTEKDYKRFALTDSGISPRGVPGYGDGLVAVDSDEHTEDGHITEDADVRNQMVEKRLKRFDLLKKAAIPPSYFGSPKADILLVAWGSTLPMVQEALEKLQNPSIGLLHFSQVYPLPENISSYFSHAKKIIVIENSENGQFADLLKLEADVKIDHKILKYNGLPFSVEELTDKINSLVKPLNVQHPQKMKAGV